MGGLPRVGDPHPFAPSIVCDSVIPEPLPNSKTKAKVVVSYSPLKFGNSSPDDEGQTQIRLSATVMSIKTNKFFNNATGQFEDMILTYTYPDDDPDIGAKKTIDQVGEVDKQVPLLVASFSRKEASSPLKKAQTFLGKLNSTKFQNGDRHTWLCTVLNSDSSDGGETYAVNYEFIYMSDTWDPVVSFIDSRTQKPPSDIDKTRQGIANKGKAQQRFQVIGGQVDFNKLKLPEIS